jgi:flavin-dependent dehydrogenase
MDPSVGRVFRGIRFLDETSSAEAKFSHGSGLGVRRTVLHQSMVNYAEECGVEILWNAHVTGIFQNCAIVKGQRILSKWIVGADGTHSRVRRWCGLHSGKLRNVRFAQRRHYRVTPWTDCVEVYWGSGMQAYVTPLANDEMCVVLISRDPRMRFAEAIREFPKLLDSLERAELTSVQRGAVTAMCRMRRVYRGNVALVGDASGSVDAITGEGLGLAFRQALVLADALNAGALQDYQLAHTRLAQRPATMARLLLLLDRFAPLRRRVFRELARDPQLFDGMLKVQAEETSQSILVQTGARLGWRLLTA